MPDAHVMFFDRNDNVIRRSYVLFADGDLELKSGTGSKLVPPRSHHEFALETTFLSG